MSETLLSWEPIIRLSFFFGIFTLMALWELAMPRRSITILRQKRWPANIGIVVFNSLLVRVIFPGSAVAIAMTGEQAGWGLFNALALPTWLTVLIAVIILDLAIYLQHLSFHHIPVLWRLHRMHHTDLHFDVTTGARFHPIEILVSMLIKLSVVLVIGAPALAVLIFEVLLNATAMFNHANVRIALPLDRYLRKFVVTPDMHRVHHSIIMQETNSNYGFNLPWWDYLFRTYRDQPEKGHDGMTIGLENFRSENDLKLYRILTQPWRKS